jgi:carboxymethylenebutenolidase
MARKKPEAAPARAKAAAAAAPRGAAAGGAVAAGAVEFTRDGATRAGYLARPDGPGPHPAVLVVHSQWGLTDHIREVARRFAATGYVALAPDLFHGEVTDDPKAAGKLMTGLSKAEGIKELLAAVAYLMAQPAVRNDRIGVTGYSMGGSYALLLPCLWKDIRAAAAFYGEVPSDKDLVNLACPVLYVYADQDFWITPHDVNRLREGLQKFSKQGEVKVYEGAPHDFFNDTRKDVYRGAEARDAWQRTLDLFARHLSA